MSFYEDMIANGAIVEPPTLLPKTRKRKGAGGALTQNVQPGQGEESPVPTTARGKADYFTQQGLDAYAAEPNVSGLQQYAKTRAAEGDQSMLNALAAQFAGERFEPVQGQYLKRALAAQEPLKVGNSGYITPTGEYVKDPTYMQDRKADRYLQLGQLYSAQAQREDQAKSDNLLRLTLGAMRAGSGDMGAGPSPQVGSTQSGAPIFRNSKQGYLFTYDESGQPTAYAGPVLPKATSAQPSEDERKAAGWFAQADNARRNMTSAMTADPSASMPTFREEATRRIPLIGEAWANSLRPANRQMFLQAASSMSEALLRAATGAGINEYEAKQKVSELVPVLNDKPETIKQKLEAYDIYMAALKARAGRAMPQLEAAVNEIYQRRDAAGTGGASSAGTVIDLPPPRRN